jgi:hypothetical protein
MYANPVDVFAGPGPASSGNSAEAPRRLERRRRVRTPVHWPVTIFRSQSAETVESTTANLSSEGFYCSTKVPFVPGERLLALLHAPSHDPTAKESTCALTCQAQVVRIEPGDGTFGVACRIEDFSLAHAGKSGNPSAGL